MTAQNHDNTKVAENRDGLRERKREDTRARMIDAMAKVLAAGNIDINHDIIAAITGISRRSVYRYFPDREAMFDGLIGRIREMAGKNVALPRSEAELIDTIRPTYVGFDRIAPIAILLRTTPQGRAIRMANKDQRVEAYRAAMADAVRELPEADRKLATAMLQAIHTTPWLEMRDNWNLDGEEIACAVEWAILTLLDDLHRRGAKPLAAGPSG